MKKKHLYNNIMEKKSQSISTLQLHVMYAADCCSAGGLQSQHSPGNW